MKHYIYILSNPINGEIFYVGCTQNIKQRTRQHKYAIARKAFDYKKSTPKDIYILQMMRDPICHVIETVVGFTEVALIRESFWITFLLSHGYPLVNKVGKSLDIKLGSELYGLPKNFSLIEIKELNDLVSEVLETEKAA